MLVLEKTPLQQTAFVYFIISFLMTLILSWLFEKTTTPILNKICGAK